MPALDAQLAEKIRAVVPRLEGWCSVEKALAMAQSICDSRPRVCVEIGVFGGRSLLPQALACQSLEQGHVFGVDPWSAADSLECMHNQRDLSFWAGLDHEQIYHGCFQAIRDEGLTRYCSLLRLPAQQAVDVFSQIDFLHIDGNHNRDVALRDVLLYLPKVRSGGDIWFDDTDWESTQDALRILRLNCDVVHEYETYIHLKKRVSVPEELHLTNGARKRTLQRRLLEVPERVLELYRGGVYNPGAVAIGENLVLLARNERFTELDRQAAPWRLWGSCRPLVMTLNRSGELTSTVPLSVPADIQSDRAEDFRLFRWESTLYTSFSRVQRSGQIKIRVAAVDLVQRRMGRALEPIVDFPTNPVEKNWCYFEHQTELYLIYTFSPFRLLRLVDRDRFRFETVLSAPLSIPGAAHGLHFASAFSLSTPPFEYQNELLMFIHRRDATQVYHQYAVWLDRQTLRPLRMSRFPVFSGGDARGLRPSVLYLMSVVPTDHEYWFFFGEGDDHVSSLRLSEPHLKELLKDTIDIALDDLPTYEIAGKYSYEHQGQFQRDLTLAPDGSIRDGQGHDSAWRLERVGEQVELWILGEGGVSCRMTSHAPGSWRGVWNRGKRPQVSLTRTEFEM